MNRSRNLSGQILVRVAHKLHYSIKLEVVTPTYTFGNRPLHHVKNSDRVTLLEARLLSSRMKSPGTIIRDINDEQPSY
jgi:hypothetical protein